MCNSYKFDSGMFNNHKHISKKMLCHVYRFMFLSANVADPQLRMFLKKLSSIKISD